MPISHIRVPGFDTHLWSLTPVSYENTSGEAMVPSTSSMLSTRATWLAWPVPSCSLAHLKALVAVGSELAVGSSSPVSLSPFIYYVKMGRVAKALPTQKQNALVVTEKSVLFSHTQTLNLCIANQDKGETNTN